MTGAVPADPRQMGNREPSGRPLVAGMSEWELIGRGGFGSVYRAFQPAYERVVAVKLVDRESTADAEAGASEVRAMGRLSGHPNIVTVHEAGITAAGDLFIIMEYLQLGSLADKLRSEGPLAWEDVCGWGVKLCGALDAAHRSGIVHRDVKPANVLLSAYGEPKLGDFGIAKIAGATATEAGLVASVNHAAPELFDGAAPSAVTDVYSLASTLATLLLGRAPYAAPGDSVVAAIERIRAHEPPDLGGVGVPGPVASVILRALSLDPTERPQTAARFAADIQEAQRLCGVVVVATAQPAGHLAGRSQDETRDVSAEPGVDRFDQAERASHAAHRRVWVGAAVVAVLVAATFGTWLLAFGMGSRDTGSASESETAAPVSADTTSSTVTTASAASTAAPQLAPTDLCAALPQEQVSQLVGNPVTMYRTATGATCAYNAADANGTGAAVTVSGTTAARFAGARDLAAAPEDVPGLGDEAFYSAANRYLMVRIGDTAYMVNLIPSAGSSPDEAALRDSAIALGRALLAS